MNKVLILILSIAILAGCKTKKKYYYREGAKDELIEAESDSAAYLQAYQMFQISSKVYNDMGKSLGNTYLTKPVSFELHNDKHEDITYRVYFENKDSLEKDIATRIQKLPNSIEKASNQSINASEVETVSKVDPALFKTLTESKTVSYEGIKVNVKSISTSNQWTFDSYDDEWRYRSAERGSKYLVSKVSISSKTNNPELPPISVYKVFNGNIQFLGNMDYEFSRWKSYGHYLGNYTDYGNDFAHSETIPFSCGLSIKSDDLNGAAIIVVVHHKGCYYRSESEIGSPDVAYRESGCSVELLDPKEAGKSYTVIKVFNKSKL